MVNVGGTKLKSLEGMSTRPTLDFVKEALFNIISNNIYDSVVLDLFSGSGSLGIEALSRGAYSAVLCDSNLSAVKIIQDNLNKTKLKDKCEVINKDYNDCLEQLKLKNITFDLIFLDPPYNKGLGVKSLEEISKLKLLKQNGIIVLETSKEEHLPEQVGNYEIYDRRIYGKSMLSFLHNKKTY